MKNFVVQMSLVAMSLGACAGADTHTEEPEKAVKPVDGDTGEGEAVTPDGEGEVTPESTGPAEQTEGDDTDATDSEEAEESPEE